jgi:hypothetical protein
MAEGDWKPAATDTGANDISGLTQGDASSRGTWFLRPKPVESYVPSGLTPEQQKEYYQVRNYAYYDPSDIEGAYDSLDPNTQLLFQVVAEAGGGRSGSALFNRYATESKRRSASGIRQSPMDILYDVAYKKGILKDDGTFEVPSSMDEAAATGAYRGPIQAVTRSSERDLRMTADALASDLLGRAVTDEEFQKVLAKVRSAEVAEPTVTTRATGSTVTESGLSAEGRKDIIREALSKGPEAQEFTQATTMMDLFGKWLERRPG